ncbi:MAG: insulinase family protein [Alphaproteobacteria bacterium]|nr:insulinase family protein [Alphaproteobacteria bacterium]
MVGTIGALVVAWWTGVAVAQDDTPSTAWTLPSFDIAFPTGFRWMVAPDHDAPVVGLAMAVDVGSAGEDEGRFGLAHLVEHLWFRSHAEGRPPTWDLLQALGCEVNALTSRDVTRYQTACPANVLPWVMQLEGRRLSDPLAGVSEEDFAHELRVVIAERALYGSAADLQDRILTGIHGVGHPYGHLPAGTLHDLEALTLDDAKAFVAAHYRPQDASFVVTGDVDGTSLSRLLFRVFAPTTFHPDLQAGAAREREGPEALRVPGGTTWYWPDDPARPGTMLQAVPPVVRQVLPFEESPPQDEPIVLDADVEHPSVRLVWTLPPFDPDAARFDGAVLAFEAEDLLRKAGELHRIAWVSCDVEALRREALLTCRMATAGGVPGDAALEALRRAPAIDHGTSGLHWSTHWAMQFLLLSLEGVAEPVGGRLEALLDHTHAGVTLGIAAATERRLRERDPTAARAYLREQATYTRSYVVRLEPVDVAVDAETGRSAGEDPGLSGADVALASELPAGFDATQHGGTRLQVASRVLPNGVRVVAVSTGTYPVVDVAVYSDLGPDALDAGVVEIAASMAAPVQRSPRSLLPYSRVGLQDGGAAWWVRSDAGSADVAIATVRQMLQDVPKAAPHVAAWVQQQRARRRRTPSIGTQATRLVASALPSWPARLSELPDARLAELAQLKPAELVDVAHTVWDPHHTVVVVAGRLNPEATVMRVADAFASWHPKARPLAPKAPVTAQAAPILVGVDTGPGALASVTTTCVSPATGADGAVAVELVDGLLDRAQFRALRAEAGLAYAPRAWSERRGDVARYTLQAVVPADEVGTALTFQRALLQQVAERGFLPEDVLDARRVWLLSSPLRRSAPARLRGDLAGPLLDGVDVEAWRAGDPLVADIDAERLRALMAGCATEMAAQVWGDLDVVAAPAQAAFPGRYVAPREPDDDRRSGTKGGGSGD